MQCAGFNQSDRPQAYRSAGFVGALLGASIFLGCTGTAIAQEVPERILRLGLDIYQTKGNCQFCHAWHGNGDQGYGGNASSLRTTFLDRETMIEVVRCGRPGTPMPKHDRQAFRDGNCYGMDEADLSGQKIAVPRAYLHSREIEAVVDYIMVTYVGQPEPGLEDCIKFWGEETRQCDGYRDQ